MRSWHGGADLPPNLLRGGICFLTKKKRKRKKQPLRAIQPKRLLNLHSNSLLLSWRATNSQVEDPSDMLLFYKDELDRIWDEKFIWQPYSDATLDC